MTRKLEELFGLDSGSEYDIASNSEQSELLETVDSQQSVQQTQQQALTNLQKIENALSAVKDLDGADKELDEIADIAKDSANTLLDLGMQVDSRFSAEIFNSASSFLGHALSAKTAKINKKLKTIQLQLQKAELDRKLAAQEAAAASKPPEETPLGQATVLDRNELIKQILAQQDKDDQKDK